MTVPSSASPAVPGWWHWLSSPVLNQHAFRFAGLLVGLNVTAWLLIGLSGADIFDRRLPIALFPMAGFVIWSALVIYRRRRDTEMGFGRGLRLGFIITTTSSLVLALLLGASVVVGSEGLRQRHVQSTLALLATQRQRIEALPNGKALYAQQATEAQHFSAATLATNEALSRTIPALLAALLGAILFRKANPEGTEPEKAPRPPKESKNG